MLKLSKKRTKKAGLPSETLIYTGERKDGKITIDVIDYDESSIVEMQQAAVEACIPYKDKPTVTWINVDGVHNPAELEKLGDCFGLHRLVVEDILNTDQRPKSEDYGDYLYLVLKMISLGKAEIVAEQLSIILGRVSFFPSGRDRGRCVRHRERLRTGKGAFENGRRLSRLCAPGCGGGQLFRDP
jgi:magnesium transporter